MPLETKVYEKLSRAENAYGNDRRKFDICYVEGLRHYLPQDFFDCTNLGDGGVERGGAKDSNGIRGNNGVGKGNHIIDKGNINWTGQALRK